MTSKKCSILHVLFLLFLTSPGAHAGLSLWLEGSSVWQSRNEVQIPGDSGSRFKITDFSKGPFAAYRAYLGYTWSDRHELRLLWAPLSAKFNGRFSEPVSFQGVAFAKDTSTEAFYKFNSYRLTYAYHFDPVGDWKFAVGLTAKVRDAEIRLTQGAVNAKKTNVGFVPLLNFQAHRAIGEKWGFRGDVDGLAAPQGRAVDATLMLERQLAVSDGGNIFKAGLGYRTVEGGADNKVVYNFAWLHYLSLSLRGEF